MKFVSFSPPFTMAYSPSASATIDNYSNSSERRLADSSNSSKTHHAIPPFSATFTDQSMVTARKIYFKVLFGGSLALVVVMFAVFSIYWGALWKTPAHNLHGWVVVRP